jgi:putative transposase
MQTILFWHGKRWFVYALTVMPDHVHILAQPMEKSPGVWYSLRQLLPSVKRTTAWEINRLRGRRGRLWQSERMDRMVRNQAEFDEKAGYILDNARRKGLVEDGREYEWFWYPGKEELRRLKQA